MADQKSYLLQMKDVEGESQTVGYVGWIELDNWNWGVLQTTTKQVGGGLAAGKASVTEFNMTKTMDKASPLLADHAATGRHLSDAKLVARKMGAQSGQYEEYARYIFKDIVVTNITLMGMGEGGELPTENVSFAFGEVTIEYDEIKQGQKQGAVMATYNAKTNVVS